MWLDCSQVKFETRKDQDWEEYWLSSPVMQVHDGERFVEASPEQIEEWSAEELRTALDEAGVNYTLPLEKQDLAALLLAAMENRTLWASPPQNALARFGRRITNLYRAFADAFGPVFRHVEQLCRISALGSVLRSQQDHADNIAAVAIHQANVKEKTRLWAPILDQVRGQLHSQQSISEVSGQLAPLIGHELSRPALEAALKQWAGDPATESELLQLLVGPPDWQRIRSAARAARGHHKGLTETLSVELEHIHDLAERAPRRTPARWVPAVTLRGGAPRVLHAGVILAPRLRPGAVPKTAFAERSLMSLVDGALQHEPDTGPEPERQLLAPPGLDVLAGLRRPSEGLAEPQHVEPTLAEVSLFGHLTVSDVHNLPRETPLRSVALRLCTAHRYRRRQGGDWQES